MHQAPRELAATRGLRLPTCEKTTRPDENSERSPRSRLVSQSLVARKVRLRRREVRYARLAHQYARMVDARNHGRSQRLRRYPQLRLHEVLRNCGTAGRPIAVRFGQPLWYA